MFKSMDARKCYVTVLLAGLVLAILVAEIESRKGGGVARTSSRSLGSLGSRRNSRDGGSRRRGHYLHSNDEINLMAGSGHVHDTKKFADVKKTAPGESDLSSLKKTGPGDASKKVINNQKEPEDIPVAVLTDEYYFDPSQSSKSRSLAGERNVPESGQNKPVNLRKLH